MKTIHHSFIVRREHETMRVLIVEDDRRLANMLCLGLVEEGFGVDLVEDGEEAVAVATPFDVITLDIMTLDIMLPGASGGFEVCSKLLVGAGSRRAAA